MVSKYNEENTQKKLRLNKMQIKNLNLAKMQI